MSTAEDCGILHGCENGRCIRVSEGYTCDCYHGYALDMTSMACVGESPPTRAGVRVLTEALFLNLCWQTWTSVRTGGTSRVSTRAASTRTAPSAASACEDSS